MRTVAALVAANKRLRKVAYQDSLTGIPNRRFFEERTNGRHGYLLVADLDGFKVAQDAHPEGHIYGDRVLREFASFLFRQTRSERDRVAARMGGDEFVVWCPTREGAQKIAARIRQWSSNDGKVTASVGIGYSMVDADADLYSNKHGK